MKRQFTDDELILRVWDIENIKTLMNVRSYYIAGDLREQELEELWVSSPENMKTASFGRNWGWYTGMESIRGYYVNAHQSRLENQMKANGTAQLNAGNLYAHPISTGLVRVAEDGKTAKGMWYSTAQETTALPDGAAEARWMMEKLAADFVREDDGWKIWHLMIAADLNSEAGEDYSSQPVYVDWDRDFVKCEFGKPDIEALCHDATFNWWDNYPPMPMPYETFTDDISYGPEGFIAPALKGLNAGEGRNYI